jgi:hypothetical protein
MVPVPHLAALLDAVHPTKSRSGAITTPRIDQPHVAVAIGPGGCFETSRPRSHDAPAYEAGGVIHYRETRQARPSAIADGGPIG